jgi:hypothetical protein
MSKLNPVPSLLKQGIVFQPATMATKRYSIAVRITTGLLGVAGVAAIGFDFLQKGGLEFSVMPLFVLFAKLFAAYIFFYVAFYGTSPLALLNMDDDGR